MTIVEEWGNVAVSCVVSLVGTTQEVSKKNDHENIES